MHLAPGSTFGGVDDGADAGGDAAADVADLVERRVVADSRHRDFRQHGEIGEGRAAHIVVDLLPAEREARRAVGHDALALRGADRGAQIGLARQARRAGAAFRRVERDDVVALFDRGDARPDIDDDARALVTEDRRKQPFRVGAREGEFVGVANPGRLDLDQNFAGARAFELHSRHFERFAGGGCHGGANIHDGPRSSLRRKYRRGRYIKRRHMERRNGGRFEWPIRNCRRRGSNSFLRPA